MQLHHTSCKYIIHTAMQFARFADCSIRVYRSVFNGFLKIFYIFDWRNARNNSLHCAITQFFLCYALQCLYIFQYAQSHISMVSIEPMIHVNHLLQM